MKKSIFLFLALLAGCMTLYWDSPSTETTNHVSSKGKKCRATVGCNCSGFSPVSTVGEKQFICKYCNHAKKYH